MGTVTPYETNAGRRWRVRYRTSEHRQTDERGFKTKRDAELYLANVEVSGRLAVRIRERDRCDP